MSVDPYSDAEIGGLGSGPRYPAPNLSEFLLARITEDEATARVEAALRYDDPYWSSGEASGYERRMTPARVLAECEVKRAIVDLCQIATSAGCPDDPYQAGYINGLRDDSALRLLALPYADHEDYREEWKP